MALRLRGPPRFRLGCQDAVNRFLRAPRMQVVAGWGHHAQGFRGFEHAPLCTNIPHGKRGGISGGWRLGRTLDFYRKLLSLSRATAALNAGGQDKKRLCQRYGKFHRSLG